MSQSINRDHSTHVLDITARILQTITPDTLASLLLVYGGTTSSQKEVADAINRDQSTVSAYFQSLTLEKTPVSLIVKPGLRYTVTDAGEEVISLLSDMFENFDEGLDTIDWGSTTDKERIGALLSPMCESRSVAPFFVLDSLWQRSNLAHIHDDPDPVWLDDVVRDVETRLQEMGESTSNPQIWQIATRFAEKDAITFDGSQLTLDEKGREHAYLLDQLARFVAIQMESDNGEDVDTVKTAQTEMGREGQDDLATATESSDSSSHQMTISSGTGQQIIPQQSQEVQLSSATNQTPIQENATVMTVYCLRSNDRAEVDEESDLESSPILPVTAMTAGDLIETGKQIAQEYGEDVELVPYRMVQTNSGLYPLTSLDSYPANSS
jgi:hypothetical protein